MPDCSCTPRTHQSQCRSHVGRKSAVLDRRCDDPVAVVPAVTFEGKNPKVILMERAKTIAVHHQLCMLIAYQEVWQKVHAAADLHTFCFVMSPDSMRIELLLL